MKYRIITFLFLASLVFGANAQDKMLTSDQLMDGSLYPARMRGLQFIGKTDNYSFVKDNVLYTANNKSEKQLLTLEQLNEALKTINGQQLRYFPNVSFINDREFSFYSNGKMFVYNLKSKTISNPLEYPANAENLDIEKTTHQYAYTKGYDLYVVKGNKEKVFSGEDNDIVYGQAVHRSEFGIEKGTFWSPKGSLLAFYKMDQSMVTDYPIVNTALRVAETAPEAYPMAGMKSHEVEVGIYNTLNDKVVYLKTRKDTSVAERENYLTNISWSPDERYVYIAKINRGQNHMWLECYNVESGNLEKVLFEEKNDRYVEPMSGLTFVPNNPNQFLWLSQRDGYRHIYLYDIDGNLLKQVTKGNFEVQSIIGFDAKAEKVFFYSNIENPMERAAYSVDLKTGNIVRITSEKGTHSIVMNSKGNMFIDMYSSTDVPFKAMLVNDKAKTLKDIHTSANPLADYRMPEIEVGTIKSADGVTDLCYRLIKPINYNDGKKHPTLVYVYGGPHSQMVTESWLAGANLYFLFLAQQGYVVFTVDNRGTDNRGFEFESVIHRNLGVAEMADQMKGVEFLRTLPYVDENRIGVEGWSFGGFMTISLKLTHPDVFKVGCAGGPVIDWKWYEVMYGERYMDTPQENPEGYKSTSLLGKVNSLDGKLLVIHGAEDPTVLWQHSLEFVHECIKAKKQVDYFVYPHHPHNVRGLDRLHLYKKMYEYYQQNL
ncbi:MAG: DPP IV N-terminal domain-containing protein [Bacteroidales bacterium]|nr:DPP IV N-terminal domain-containing protein [Bacteroidales bacterium]MBR5777862.1 DPP IV N-terminal domain-containing protein [Bacteroidales bacterium]